MASAVQLHFYDTDTGESLERIELPERSTPHVLLAMVDSLHARGDHKTAHQIAQAYVVAKYGDKLGPWLKGTPDGST